MGASKMGAPSLCIRGVTAGVIGRKKPKFQRILENNKIRPSRIRMRAERMYLVEIRGFEPLAS